MAISSNLMQGLRGVLFMPRPLCALHMAIVLPPPTPALRYITNSLVGTQMQLAAS
jgi:hypothetical protein